MGPPLVIGQVTLGAVDCGMQSALHSASSGAAETEQQVVLVMLATGQ